MPSPDDIRRPPGTPGKSSRLSRRSVLHAGVAIATAATIPRRAAASATATAVDECGQVANSGQDRRQHLQSILDNYGPELGTGH
jgi:hypothetical protein